MPLLLKIGLPLAGGFLLLGTAAYYYFAYAPRPAEPALRATVQTGTLQVGHRSRTYRAYTEVLGFQQMPS